MDRRAITFTVALLVLTTMSASAQTATKLAASNPDVFYEAFRRTFSETDYWTERPLPTVLAFRRSIGHDQVYLTSCLSAGEFLGYGGSDDPLTRALADLAFEILSIEFELQLFPPELWKADLEGYARQRAKAIAQGQAPQFDAATRTNSQLEKEFKVSLAAKLNAYRSGRQDLPEVTIPWGGCGGNVLKEIAIVVRPPASRIRYINFHYFALCREENIDPVRDARCDLWTDYSGSTSRLQVGNYKVLVQWSDGTMSLRDLDLQSLVGTQFIVVKE